MGSLSFGGDDASRKAPAARFAGVDGLEGTDGEGGIGLPDVEGELPGGFHIRLIESGEGAASVNGCELG